MECKARRGMMIDSVCEGDMTSWRRGEYPTYADTYIEYCFEKRCRELKDGVDILTEWREKKRQYISYLETAVFEFQHYSRHDASHSISVLESIEMLLGKERVDMLSAGDLWMLLECAYMHDLGMSLTYKDLLQLWEEDVEFKKYVNALLEEEDGIKKSAIRYKQLDNLIHNRKKMEGIAHIINRKSTEVWKDSWPIEFERDITLLIAEYVRRHHAQRVMQADNKLDEKKQSVIPIRLYKLRALVASLHGESFEKIISSLEPCAKGFGNTHIHPRFAAAMLRIADLLDMENNRFNINAMEHFGQVPYYSMLHFEKHKAITHISICPREISAEAISDKPEVCEVVSNWFLWLDEEVKNLICFWNEIVPPKLIGCLLKICTCKVYLETDSGKQVFDARPGREFEVDRRKLLELMIGLGFYEFRIDFIREYLQNAIDATKMKLWRDIKSGLYEFSKNFNSSTSKNINEFTPFDVGQEIYDLYTIDMKVEFDLAESKVKLAIVDKGIGIEKSCMDVISKVGSGWRKREEYKEDLQNMPRWMKPTGGFGIGIQSAFMVTDEVEILTKAIGESQGRRIRLLSSHKHGQITEETMQGLHEGTSVNITMDMKWILNWNDGFEQNKSKEDSNSESINFKNRINEYIYELLEGTDLLAEKNDWFNERLIEEYVVSFIVAYIKCTIPNPQIPIRIVYKKGETTVNKVISSKIFNDRNYWEDKSSVIKRQISVNGYEYQCFYCPDDPNYHIRIWDNDRQINCCFSRVERNTTDNFSCFKNILAKNEQATRRAYEKYLGNKLIDFQGFYSEDILKIHRDTFKADFDAEKYFEDFLKVYFRFLDTISERSEINTILKDPRIRIIRALVLKQKRSLEEVDNVSENERIRIETFCFDKEKDTVVREESTCSVEQIEEDIIKSLSVAEQSDISEAGNGIFAYAGYEYGKTSDISERRINSNRYHTWIECKKGNESLEQSKTSGIDFFSDEFEILDLLNKKGYIILDQDVAEILLDYNEYSRKSLIIADEKKKILLFYMENEPLQLETMEFYRHSFEDGQYGMFFVDKDAERYPTLKVKRLPKEGQKGCRKGALISPIGEEEYRKLVKLYGKIAPLNIDEQVSRITFEQFRDCIVSGIRYKILIQWVYGNQVEEYKESIQKIEESYEAYIRKIYEWKDAQVKKF